jgi:hypothetical protein
MEGFLVRTLALVALTATAITLAGCKKTGEGEYEVERPTVGTTTDTVRTPTVDVGTTTDTLVVKRPTVDVKNP